MTRGGTRTDFIRFTNADSKIQQSIEENCDTLAKAASNKCTFSIQYVYEERHVEDSGNGREIIFIRAVDDEGEIITRR